MQPCRMYSNNNNKYYWSNVHNVHEQLFSYQFSSRFSTLSSTRALRTVYLRYCRLQSRVQSYLLGTPSVRLRCRPCDVVMAAIVPLLVIFVEVPSAKSGESCSSCSSRSSPYVRQRSGQGNPSARCRSFCRNSFRGGPSGQRTRSTIRLPVAGILSMSRVHVRVYVWLRTCTRGRRSSHTVAHLTLQAHRSLVCTCMYVYNTVNVVALSAVVPPSSRRAAKSWDWVFQLSMSLFRPL